MKSDVNSEPWHWKWPIRVAFLISCGGIPQKIFTINHDPTTLELSLTGGYVTLFATCSFSFHTFPCCFFSSISSRDHRSQQILSCPSCRSAKKTVPDVYMGNLAVADLVHVTVMPFLIHQWARGGQWVFGSTLCTIITSLDNCNQVACAAVMTAMSLDRFVIREILIPLFFSCSKEFN